MLCYGGIRVLAGECKSICKSTWVCGNECGVAAAGHCTDQQAWLVPLYSHKGIVAPFRTTADMASCATMLAGCCSQLVQCRPSSLTLTAETAAQRACQQAHSVCTWGAVQGGRREVSAPRAGDMQHMVLSRTKCARRSWLAAAAVSELQDSIVCEIDGGCAWSGLSVALCRWVAGKCRGLVFAISGSGPYMATHLQY
jgi:hypothetical protein